MTLSEFKKWLKGYSLGVVTCPDKDYYDMEDVLHTINLMLATVTEKHSDPCDCSKCIEKTEPAPHPSSKMYTITNSAEELAEFAAKLAAAQEPVPAEFEKTFRDRINDLYA